jgi:integrase
VRGHIARRGSGWHCFFDRPRDPLTGRRRKTSKGPFPTKKAAQQWLSRQFVDMQRGSYIEPSAGRQLFGAYLQEDWLPSLDARGLAPNTLKGYKATIRKHVVKHDVAAIPLERLSPERLNKLYADLVARGLSPRTTRYVAMIVGQSLRDAERWQRIVRNPARFASPPSASAALRDAERARKAWSATELRTFLESTAVREDRLRALWATLATTGARRGEALGLAWRHIDFENSRLSIVQALSQVGDEIQVTTPKSERGKRMVALDAYTLEALKAHRRAQLEERLSLGLGRPSEDDFVFAQPDGQPLHPNAVTLAFQHRLKAAGLRRIRLHDLQHTAASLMLQAGVNPKVASERLGHSSPAFTLAIYSHSVPAMQEEAAETG